MRNIAIFGGSFNPPGLHHRRIAEELGRIDWLDEIIVLPCGMRPDKETTNFIPPIHRAAMVDMTFGGMPKVTVDLSDLEHGTTFTPTIELEESYRSNDTKVWHAIGCDLIGGGKENKSEIQTSWKDGQRLWHEANFIVVHRPGTELSDDDLPPNRSVLANSQLLVGSSTHVRELIFNGQPYEHLLTPRVAEYIRRHGLYRGGAIGNTYIWTPPTNRDLGIMCHADKRNGDARRAATVLHEQHKLTADRTPDVFVSLGGDGQLLSTIRHDWRDRVPFIGLNFGHHGFLLNPADTELNQPMMAFHLPMLHVEITTHDGHTQQHIAFNDVWWERSSPSMAWMQVEINGETRITKLESDGIIVATPQGSTAYARAMGAPPLPLDSQAMIIAGNNVTRPNWRYATLPTDAQVDITNLAPEFRPVRAIIDGNVVVENVVVMRVRRSNIAAVELLLDPRLDIGAKMVAAQFPT